MNGNFGQPIFILPEGALRTKGKDALRNNIAAGKAVADAVKTTLGPKGMDKMLVDSLGDIVVTNDGATILEEMQIENPAAKMIVEVAKTQDKIVGDGTTTAAVIAGELLKKAEDLLEQEIHPTIITKGFMIAKEHALEYLDQTGIKVGISDDRTLLKIATTAMTGKSAERASEELGRIVVDAITRVAVTEKGQVSVDTENIKIEKREGGSLTDSQLIQGIAIDKEIVHSGMPKSMNNARIALLDVALETKELEGDAKINVDSPEKLQAFLNQEERGLREMVDKVIKTGANVVFCQKGIDDVAQHYLAKAKILAARRVKKSDMEQLAKATGGKLISSLNDMSSDYLGAAGNVHEEKIAGEEMLFIEGCKDPKAVTILVRGGTQHIVDEAERAVTDAVRGVGAALELGKIVPGGGASEIGVARHIRKIAEKYKGREQLAINAFAEALEVIPRTLAENSGFDPIDVIAALRAEHEKGQSSTGLDCFSGKTGDMIKNGVVEPLKIKLQAIKSAAEAAEMILRIDDIIQSSKRGPPMPPGGGGMGDMD